MLEPLGTSMKAMPSAGIESVTTAPTAARVLVWVAVEVPGANSTM